ncbi:MAG: LysR family transcriptional regulator [Telluria sp.]|nr:LysR family transcriptional regulator [Telluria sp.]
MDPSKMDLNLLTVFVQLYEDRKVSLAAENLGLSQPAVSSALGRLRRMLGDEVFLRTARGMQPTPLADQLAVPIADALTAIRESLFQPLLFDAATSCRQFTFAMTDIGEFHFLPQLMEKLETLAPGVTISTVRSTAINLKFEMETGKVDLALGHLPDLTAGFHCRTLFSQRYVCLFRRGHAIDQGTLSVETFAAAEHAVVISAGTGHGHADEFLQRAGILRRIRLRVPHFVALADILESSDLIATVPVAFAIRSIKHFDLRYAPHPIDLPLIDINLFWHSKYHREPANRWLRELIAKHFRVGDGGMLLNV